MDRKRMLVFRPEHNSHGKKDVTGAFAPEARNYMKAVCTSDSRMFVINNRLNLKHRQRSVIAAFEEMSDTEAPFDGVAFLCHGWTSGIQLGFKNADVALLAGWVNRLCEHSFPVVPLYCCSTGGDPKSKNTSPGTGDNSFADLLRDALCASIAADGLTPYPRVFSHETVAHATRNPRVRVFDGQGSSEGGVGGYRPIKIGGSLWKAWKRELRDTKKNPAHRKNFRFHVPHMDIPEIEAWLEEAA